MSYTRVKDEAYTVNLNSTDDAAKSTKSNRVRTSKYTLLTFLPLNLLEQFRRLANVYFLFMVVLQVIPGVSPFPLFVTVSPIVFILMVSAIKEAIEDYSRHKQDKKLNHALYRRLDAKGQLVDVMSEDISNGMILHIKRGEEFPADLVLLQSSKEDGTCSITTGSLDGEAIPKHRVSPEPTKNLPWDVLGDVKGLIQAQQPNKDLYGFQGLLSVTLPATLDQAADWGLDDTTVLLRSAKLADPDWVLGAVIYAGKDTKMMLNRNPAKFKFSIFERSLNKLVIGMFAMKTIICIILTVFGATDAVTNNWLKEQGLSNEAFDNFMGFWSQFILFSFMIPLPLYVTMEIVLMGQAYFIQKDAELFARPPLSGPDDKLEGIKVKNASLNPDLGSIQWIFSDKTGTLTENKMDLSQACIRGIQYEYKVNATADSELPSLADLAKQLLASDVLKLLSNADLEHEMEETFDFFLGVLLNNSAHVIKEEDGSFMYQSDSPDEIALLEAAKTLGMIIDNRQTTKVDLAFSAEEGKEMQKFRFQVHAVLPFESSNRRMSVLIRCPNGKLKLFTKGADSAIFPMTRNTKEKDVKVRRNSETHTLYAAKRGSRTLVVAGRDISEDEFVGWYPRYKEASMALEDRSHKLATLFSELEKDLTCLGMTAVNDQLQNGVPKTIDMLHKAGIRIIVLTGDKRETAISIAYDASLVDTTMHLLELSGTTVEKAQASLSMVLKESGLAEDDSLLVNTLVQTDQSNQGNGSVKYALFCDGETLQILLTHNEAEMVKLMKLCETMVCFRSTPAQKSMAVHSVKTREKAVCLAIGDGANDVSMILEANVGVGIIGKEGAHAALSADYVAVRFMHLQRLLLVHGRWSLVRASLVALVTFYKAFAFSLPLFFYGFFSGASASFMYDAAFLSWFNVAFTNFPPFVLGLFEQDVDQKSLLRLPELYHAFQKTPSLRFGRFVYFNVLAVWQGFIIYFLTMHGPLEDVMIGGSLFSGSVYFEGNIAALLMCVVINLQMVFVSSFISKYTVGAAGFNIASFFLFFMIANSIDGFFGSDLYNLMPVVFGSPNAYFVVIITALLSFFPTLVFTSFQNFFRPSLLYELKAGLKAGRAVGSTKQFYNQIPMSTLS